MRLGIILRKYRQSRDSTLGVLAKEIGLSKATLSRIERGEKCDMDSFVKIVNWMCAGAVA